MVMISDVSMSQLQRIQDRAKEFRIFTIRLSDPQAAFCRYYSNEFCRMMQKACPARKQSDCEAFTLI